MQILPPEVIDHLIEPYSNRIRVKSQIIFISILIAIFGAIAVLPWLYVDVNISGSGILRPEVQRAEIYSPVSGKINNLFVSDNERVIEGQSLISIYPDILVQKEKFAKERIAYTISQLEDMSLYISCLNQECVVPPVFNLTYNNSSIRSFFEVYKKVKRRILAEEKKFARNSILYDQQVISKSEFEDYESALNSIKEELEIEKQSELAKREGEKKRLEEQYHQLLANLTELEKEKERYLIKAPVSGTMINMMKIHEGSFISSNQLIGEISPSSNVIAECYISPSDIGLLTRGQSIRFRIDAFNYNEWGFVDGEILEIAQDINFSKESKPYFIVKCMLDQKHLTLKNGQRGLLKKGMSVHGRFFVARRSLYQLLFDKADDWINPSSNQVSNL